MSTNIPKQSNREHENITKKGHFILLRGMKWPHLLLSAGSYAEKQ